MPGEKVEAAHWETRCSNQASTGEVDAWSLVSEGFQWISKRALGQESCFCLRANLRSSFVLSAHAQASCRMALEWPLKPMTRPKANRWLQTLLSRLSLANICQALFERHAIWSCFSTTHLRSEKRYWVVVQMTWRCQNSTFNWAVRGLGWWSSGRQWADDLINKKPDLFLPEPSLLSLSLGVCWKPKP